MKCTKCGSQIETGKVYCPVCGHEIRIVPDYNDFEEEIITELIDNDISNIATMKKDNRTSQSENKKASNQKSAEDKTTFRKPKKKFGKLQKIVVFWSIISIVTVAVLFLVFYYHMTNNFTYLYNKAVMYENQKKYTKAISYYKKALQKKENSIDTRMSLAQSYLSLKDSKEATSFYLSVLKIDDNNKSAYKGLLKIYADDKEYTQIEALYKTAKDDSIKNLFSEYIVDSPTLDKDPGIYHQELELTLTSPGKDEIYYTLDGSDPIKKGNLYISAIKLKTDGYYDIKAVCKNEKGIFSSIKSYEFEISIDQSQADDFSVTPDSGNCAKDQQISITVPEGYKVYYTWDGSTPTTASTEYTSPITVLPGNNILSVVYVDLDGNMSDVYQYNYICN